MGLAEIDVRQAHCVTDFAIVARQLRSDGQIVGRYIVAESNAERARIRLIRVVEVAPVVAAQDP